MIIRLMNANFSANNIGELTTWNISWKGDGYTYDGELPRSVKKNEPLNITVNVASGYTYDSVPITVKMGGTDVPASAISRNANGTITINIASVTGKLDILIGEVVSGGGDSGDTILQSGFDGYTSKVNTTFNIAPSSDKLTLIGEIPASATLNPSSNAWVYNSVPYEVADNTVPITLSFKHKLESGTLPSTTPRIYVVPATTTGAYDASGTSFIVSPVPASEEVEFSKTFTLSKYGAWSGDNADVKTFTLLIAFNAGSHYKVKYSDFSLKIEQ